MNITNISYRYYLKHYFFVVGRRWKRTVTLSAIAILLFGCGEQTNSVRSYKEIVDKSNLSQFVSEAKRRQSAQVLFENGNLFLNTQKYAEAIQTYDQALTIKPDFDKVWVNRGNAQTGLQKYNDAIASYNQAIHYNPQMDEAWYNRGNALSSLQKYNDAIASYNQAIKIQPDKHEAWINKGIALARIQQYKQAIAAYNQALKIKPDKDLAYYNKACAYALQNQAGLAVANLHQAILLVPGKYENLARNDNDFAKIKNNQAFRALINKSKLAKTAVN